MPGSALGVESVEKDAVLPVELNDSDTEVLDSLANLANAAEFFPFKWVVHERNGSIVG